MFPLVGELAAAQHPVRVPVTVTCRVLKLCRQQYYRWLAKPVSDAELEWAYRANALYDAHRDDPTFGYRYLVEEAVDAGQGMSARTAWSICSTNAWWSVFSKKRAGRPRPGPPVHEDLRTFEDDKGRTRHDFTAVTRLDQVWFTDITEHKTGEGKLYLYAVKDACSGRIFGYSIGSLMKSKLVVAALDSAVARRVADGVDVAGCIVQTERGSQFRHRRFVHRLRHHQLAGSMGRVGACGDNAAMESLFARLQKIVLNSR